MIINLRGIKALQQLRMEHQESAWLDFPQTYHTELLVLYDDCKYLELNIFQARDALGAQGYAYVTGYINGPVGYPTEAARQWIGSASLH